MGEVGVALYKILGAAYECVDVFDTKAGGYSSMHRQKYDYLHICFPFAEGFEEAVRQYQQLFKPRATIIHSTVPVGTSRRLKAVHSPIRGIHPFLEEGIRTFPKFLGGPKGSAVADLFRKAGLKVILVEKSETTEAGKLFDTEYYRVCIEFMQRVADYCAQHKLPFHEVYTLFNQSYNDGYTKLGHEEYVRPILQPIKGPIGGHCVIPNSKLI